MQAEPQIALFAVTTVAFASFARLLRGVTTSGSLAGGGVSFLLLLAAGWGGLAALGAVFLLTWAATRLGHRSKQSLGTAERDGGLDAGSVLRHLVGASPASFYCLLAQCPGLCACYSC